jgi:predicted ribosomally synthesized peptide with SipW-like signal peptide
MRGEKRMNKKILVSMMVIGLVAALAGAGLHAYFNDTEKSEGNKFTAGTMDLELSVTGAGVTGTHFEMGDVAPGDSGRYVFNLKNTGSIAGTLSAHFSEITNLPGTTPEPEPGSDYGELGANLYVTLWHTIDFTWEGNGISEWTNEKAHIGSYSAKLILPEEDPSGNDFAHVWIPLSDMTLNDIDSASFWYYPSAVRAQVSLEQIKGHIQTSEVYYAPFLVFELDTDGNGAGDTWVVSCEKYSPTTGTWQEDPIGVDERFHIVSILNPESTWEAITLSDVKALDYFKDGKTLGDATVLKVKIETQGCGTPYVCYVDDVKVNAVTYDLEPLYVGTLNGLGGQTFTGIATLAEMESVNLYFDWSIPGSVDNEIMGDSASFDIEFSLVQA